MNSHRIVFIVGNSRSGTTMLGRVLGNHPDVHTFDELHFFEDLVDADAIRSRPAWTERRRIELVERLIWRARHGLFAKFVAGRYGDEARTICAAAGADPVSAYESFLRFETESNGRTISCEQTPRYLYYASEILDTFPEARMINVVRDPRDVLLSQKYKWRRRELGGDSIPVGEAVRSWVNYHPFTISRLWTSASRAAGELSGRRRFTSVRFEDLVVDPAAVVSLLCGFLGIPFQTSMLDVPHHGSSAAHDRPTVTGIDASRAGSWRRGGLSPAELRICQQVTGREMERWRYARDCVRGGRLGALLRLLGLPLQLALALAMNWRRTSSLSQSLRRRLGARRGSG